MQVVYQAGQLIRGDDALKNSSTVTRRRLDLCLSQGARAEVSIGVESSAGATEDSPTTILQEQAVNHKYNDTSSKEATLLFHTAVMKYRLLLTNSGVLDSSNYNPLLKVDRQGTSDDGENTFT